MKREKKLVLSKKRLPRHVAIIMDGNRRWAKRQGLSAVMGHKKVAFGVVEELVERAVELGIPHITFWAFSTENWKRSKVEVGGVLRLFRESLKSQAPKLVKRGAKLQMIGDMSRFPRDIQAGFGEMMEASKNNARITVTFALNYGGRDELLRAIKKLATEIQDSRFKIKKLDQSAFASFLDTHGMPDPDLVIRTGGEKRLSGFMLWQVEYAELYFTDVLMPEFGPRQLDEALADYQTRKRRFGGGSFDEYGQGKG